MSIFFGVVMELPFTTALFAPLCASTIRQGEALEQGNKKNKSSCGKIPQDDFAVLLYAV